MRRVPCTSRARVRQRNCYTTVDLLPGAYPQYSYQRSVVPSDRSDVGLDQVDLVLLAHVRAKGLFAQGTFCGIVAIDPEDASHQERKASRTSGVGSAGAGRGRTKGGA